MNIATFLTSSYPAKQSNLAEVLRLHYSVPLGKHYEFSTVQHRLRIVKDKLKVV